MSRLVGLRSLIIPAIIFLLLVTAAGWFYFSWVPLNRRDLDDRNFRVLNSLSEQLSHAIDAFDKIMDNAANSGIGKDDQLNKYLANVAPELQVPEQKESKPIIGKDYSDPPKIAIAADEGTHFLYLAFINKSSGYAIRTDLDKLIEKLFPPAERNPFDVVLLSKSDGKVIFQNPSSGMVVTRIDSLEKVSENAKNGAPPPQITVKSLSQVSSREEVMLEGVPYRLYSQPLPISFPSADPMKKSSKATTEPIPEPWVLCGLVRADHFRSQSQLISYKYILGLSALILMAIAAYPFLRLYLSRCEERLRTSQVVGLAISACVIAATVTFALLDFDYWSSDFGPAATDQMKKLSASMDDNFQTEKEKAFAQLTDFFQKDLSNKNPLRTSLRQAQAHFDQHPKLAKLTRNGEACQPSWACQSKILSDDSHVAHLLKSYPYLDYVGWSDFDGEQRVKWTTKNSITPFLDLDDKSIIYYPDVKRALLSHKTPPDGGVGTHTSPNTGRAVTVFWKIMDADGNEVREKIEDKDRKKVFCASLVTNPVSVFHAILPEGFQFAIIKPDGTVVFHSQPTLNLRENFFAETDQAPSLLSRVSIRDSGPLVANYLGRPHRMYVQPMKSSPGGAWTIVVFRDLHAEETMNLEMLSLASVMFFFYALILASAFVLMWWVRRGRVIGTWIRPDWHKAVAYSWLAVANIAVIFLLLLTFALMSAPVAMISLGILVPLVTLVLNFLALRQNSNSERDSQDAPSGRGPRVYVGAFATLLVTVAVLPCLSFFKVACDFEHKLFIGSTQFDLAAQIQERAEYVRSRYQGIELRPNYAGYLLAEVENQHSPLATPKSQGTLSFSYHEVLGTEFTSSEGTSAPFIERLLNNVNPMHNLSRLAAEQHHLAEAGSNTRVWSSASSLSGDKVNLTLPKTLGTFRTISSPWIPLHVVSVSWGWWLVAAVFLAVLFRLVRFTLYKLFLLDPVGSNQETNAAAGFDPASLIKTASKNLLVIGSRSCRTIRKLISERDAQFWDTRPEPDGSIPFIERVVQIAQYDRPLVLCIVDRALDDPDSSRKVRSTLEGVLSNTSEKVIITSETDPTAEAMGKEGEQWQTLLRDFARLDLNSGPPRREGETDIDFDCRIVADAYYNWRFYSLSRTQRLVLVQLAQEGLANPNCRPVVCDLLEEGLIVRKWGTFTINGSHLADFLKAIPPNVIEDLESHVADADSASLRTSLWVVCLGLAVFLIYTQREVFSIWVTYVTGVAAVVPALIKAVSVFRGKSGSEA
jgi:hypothetical protein